MRRSIAYELAAATIMMFGVVLLVAVYFPVINPQQYNLDSGGAGAPMIRYVLGTPIALFILWVAWRVNRRAQMLNRTEKDRRHEHGLSA